LLPLRSFRLSPTSWRSIWGDTHKECDHFKLDPTPDNTVPPSRLSQNGCVILYKPTSMIIPHIPTATHIIGSQSICAFFIVTNSITIMPMPTGTDRTYYSSSALVACHQSLIFSSLLHHMDSCLCLLANALPIVINVLNLNGEVIGSLSLQIVHLISFGVISISYMMCGLMCGILSLVIVAFLAVYLYYPCVLPGCVSY
jgi:hypothetical protein